MTRHALRHALAAAALAALGPVHAANLLVNASFESPGIGYASLPGNSTFITGWKTFLSGVEYYDAGGQAADGRYVVDLANYVYSNGGIAQTFATTPGAKYEVSFYAGNVASSGRDGTGQVQVKAGDLDVTVDTAVAVSSSLYAWKLVTLQFTALAPTTTLSFENHQNSFTHFALIDGVGVRSAVPEPGTVALLAAGLLGMAGIRRRS